MSTVFPSFTPSLWFLQLFLCPTPSQIHHPLFFGYYSHCAHVVVNYKYNPVSPVNVAHLGASLRLATQEWAIHRDDSPLSDTVTACGSSFASGSFFFSDCLL